MKITPLITLLGASCITASAAEPKSEFTSLFNGKDLTGWTGSGYEVKDGAIVCTPSGKNLVTEKEYEDYVFKFDYKLSPGANNGIGINYTGEGDPAYTGLEIQVLDDTAEKYKDLKDYQFNGGIYFFKAAERGHLKPVGEWNQQTITVSGSHVKIELNGKVINEGNLDELQKKDENHTGVKRRSGHIAFCGHGDKVSYKNISIRELELPEVNMEGFESLYNGKDLSGWKQDEGHIGHWQPRGESLFYDSQSTARDKNLWTEKSYGDFTLALDWRWAGNATRTIDRPYLDPKTGGEMRDENGKVMTENVIELDSGIYLRGNDRSQVNLWNWPGGSGEVYGYRTNGNLPQEIRAALVPKVKADHPIGAWNRILVTMKGDRLTVVLNGKTVIENAQLPGVPEKGPIALQHHGSELEFRNIAIKEL